MPRPKRCAYREDGRRCTKNGTVPLGDAAVCGAHAIAFAEAAQTAASIPFGGGLAQAFTELLNGGRVRQETFRRAAGEVFKAMGLDPSGMPRMPPMPGMPPRQGVPPPRRPPQIPVDELARRRARSTLGFGNEPLTEELIKERRRVLALQHHPDRGGSAAQMAAVNHAADVLLAGLAA